MGFITKLDLSRQSTIHTGTTATWDGSISIGENLYVNNIRINPQGSVRDGDLLFYNQASNTYKRGVLSPGYGIALTYNSGNVFIEFTGSTSSNPRVTSLANLATDGILINNGSTISTVLISGSSDFNITNPNGLTGNPTLGLTNTGVSGGTYGSSSSIPVFTVDSKGRISFVSGATVTIPSNFITSLNSLTGSSQTLVTGNTGSDFNIFSSGTVHTFNIPSSSSSNRGLLIPADWNTFNNKQNQLSGTGFTFVSGTSVSYKYGTSSQFIKADGSFDSNTYLTTAILSLNGLTGSSQTLVTGNTGNDFNISSSGTVHIFNIPSSSSSNRGLLTSTDWSTFNNKQNQLSGTGFTFVSGTSVSYNNNVVTQSNLTGGTVPYFDGVNLVNNNIFSNGTNIGIGTNSPSVYSVLNLSSNLPLKLTSISTASLPSASNIGVGGFTWNNTVGALQVSDGSNWNSLIVGVGLTGGTVPYWNGSNLSNTTLSYDGTDLSIARTTILKLNTSTVGSGASLRTLISINGKRFICSSEEEINYGNLYVGKNAGNLLATTASYITAIGDQSLPLATSDYTTALGNGAGLNHTNGAWSTYLGAFAGKNNTTGARNVYVGFQAGQANNGSDNVIVGTRGVFSNSGFNNTIIIGSQADGTNVSSNKLYIDSLANAIPLVGGDFNSKYIGINGSLSVGSPTGNTNTILDLQSTTKGLGLPLVTSLPSTSRLGNLLYDNTTTGSTSGNTLVSDGTNWSRVVTTLSGSTIGTVTLVGGTATVSTSKVKNTSVILLTVQGGTLTNVGSPYVSARIAGVSFTITSTNGSDVSNVGWLLLDN